MDRQIENPDTGERVTVTGDGFQTYSNEELGRVFKDYGDGRLYEYDDNGKLMETAWAFVDDSPKHTPGPWVVERLHDGESGDIAIIGNKSPDGLRGTIVTRTTSMGGETATANAALIAAAPDMYEALRAMVDEADEHGGNERTVSRYEVDRARAALAKAEGR